jgi:DNA (cytosine-5)-methyltransferase 1
MSKKLTTISLFSGAGGMDYGFEAAGYETLVATDYEADACETLRRNGFRSVVEGDIHEISTEKLLQEAGCARGEYGVLIGGPPCQPFSKSGYWSSGESKRLDDPRAQTLDAYMRVLEESLPRAFLLENVEGMSYAGKSEGFDFLLKKIAEINRRQGTNYRPSCTVLTATDFGVPQQRSRFFMIASRDGQHFRFPDPTHFDSEKWPTRPRFTTAWDALANVQPEPHEKLQMKGKWADLLPTIPEGKNYLHHTERGGGKPLFGWRRRFWSFLLKLAKDRPSWTIQAQPGPAVGPFHWDSRLLSKRELCRLQTFPDKVDIYGVRRSVQRQLGNAVPSLLAEVLGREIAVQFFGSAVPDLPVLRVERRDDCPDPEPLAPVPKRFLSLIGKHEAHPGTGQGYGASRKDEEKSPQLLLQL